MADKIFLQGSEINTKSIKKAVSLLKKVSRVKKANFLETSLNDIAFKMQMGVENSYGVRFLSNASEEAESIAGELEAIAANLANLRKILTEGPSTIEDADKFFKGHAERIIDVKRYTKKQTFWERLFGIEPQEVMEIDIATNYDPAAQPNLSYYKILDPHMGNYSVNQNDYRATMGSVGCCAVSYAIALSIINKQPYNPDKYWNAAAQQTEYTDGGIEYYNSCSERPFDTNEICEKIKEGKPTVIHYMYEENKGQHYVTVVGIREGAIISDLGYSDILAIDPATGTVRPLSDCYNFYPEGTKSMIVFK